MVEVVKGWLSLEVVDDLDSGGVGWYLEAFLFPVLFGVFSVHESLLDVPQGDLLALDEDAREFPPLGLGQFLTMLVLSSIIDFIGQIQNQITDA